jgi:hypothetical protein
VGVVFRDFLERLARQLSQVALPILIAASDPSAARPWAIEWRTFAMVTAITMAITAAKVVAVMLAEWRAAGRWQDLLDRGLSAGLTTLLGFFPVSVVEPDAVDWQLVSYMSVLSTLIAVAQYYASPPTYSVGRHVA